MSEVQLSATSKIKTIWKRLSNKEYRDAFNSFKIDNDLAGQIFALRRQQDLTQDQLGDMASMAQSRIAKLEGSCDGVSLNTLKRIAGALDVALSVRFVPFSEMALETVQGTLDRKIAPFDNDRPPLDRFEVKAAAGTSRTYLPSSRITGSTPVMRSRVSAQSNVLQEQRHA